MCAVEPAWARAAPSANEAPTIGMVIGPGAGAGAVALADDEAFAQWRVALVEDDDAGGTGGLGVVAP